MPSPPEICPNCGASVPPRARACPGCGADETTGWSADAVAQQLGLPDDNFDYDDFTAREFGPPTARPRPRIGWFWWTVAVLLLLSFLLWGIL